MIPAQKETRDQAIAREAREYKADLAKLGRLRQADLAEIARHDVNTFAELCFQIVQQPLHLEFHARADASPKNVIFTHPETAKTYQFGLIRQLWKAGRNPERHQVHLSAVNDIPDDTLEQVAKHAHKNARVRAVFPDLKIDKGPRRNKHGLLELRWKRREEHTDRDPSMVAIGLNQKIMGRRLDDVLIDDAHDFFNTYTKEQTQKVVDNVDSQLLGRVMTGGTVTYLGHPWRKKDLGWDLKKKGYATKAYDCLCDLDGNPGPPGIWPNQVFDPITGKPYGWPWWRLMQKQKETNPFRWWVQWRCKYPEDDTELFSLKDLQACLVDAPWPWMPPRGIEAYTGVDFGTGSGRDETVLTTVYFAGGRIYLSEIRGGIWDDARFFRELLKVVRQYPNWGGVMVETNSFQKWVKNTMTDRPEVMRANGWLEADIKRLRVKGRTTTAGNKSNPDDPNSIPNLATDFHNRQVCLPRDPSTGEPYPEVSKLMDGLQDFDPLNAKKIEHTADRVISYWEAVEMMRRSTGKGNIG